MVVYVEVAVEPEYLECSALLVSDHRLEAAKPERNEGYVFSDVKWNGGPDGLPCYFLSPKAVSIGLNNIVPCHLAEFAYPRDKRELVGIFAVRDAVFRVYISKTEAGRLGVVRDFLFGGSTESKFPA